MESDPGFALALSLARDSHASGGIPIGACLVSSSGAVLGSGCNMRVQRGSATMHVSET